jgi:hypothetical protein
MFSRAAAAAVAALLTLSLTPLAAATARSPQRSDKTAPTDPTNLTATAATEVSISVQWTASTDRFGVTGYNLYRDPQAGSPPVAVTSSTSAVFGGLACGTSHELGVQAFDAAGNVSRIVSVTASTAPCPDTAPPVLPENLLETDSTTTTITVSWTASTDDVGVVGYDVFVNGVAVGTTVTTSYTAGGFVCGTVYTLGVEAYDAAGNRSLMSTVIGSTSPCPSTTITTTAPTSTSPPTISGTAQAGQTLTASAGTWTDSPTNYAYQWQRCDSTGASCAAIAGSTTGSYVLAAADVGATIRVRVTATNSGGAAAATSAASAVVIDAPTPSTSSSAVPVPSSGAYLGAWTSPNTGYSNDQREQQLGRKYNIVHRYHDWPAAFPDSDEITWARNGRILYLAWETRIYGTGQVIPWADIASGKQDAQIDTTASRIKDLGYPVFMDIQQEPEDWVSGVGSLGAAGSASDYAAAYRHIVQRFRAEGATNVSWVWDTMGYSGYYSLYTGGLYPGDDVVDWIGWDPYNWYLCHGSAWKSFADKVTPFYNWLLQNGHGNKPFMLSEWGSRESDTDASAKQKWFTDARNAMKAGTFPNLKALIYFDSRPSECDWRVDTSSSAFDGFKALASDPFFNP